MYLEDVVDGDQEVTDVLLVVDVQGKVLDQGVVVQDPGQGLGEAVVLVLESGPALAPARCQEGQGVGLQVGVQLFLGLWAEQVDLAEDVDMGELQIDHARESRHGAGEELRTVDHEVGVDKENAA